MAQSGFSTHEKIEKISSDIRSSQEFAEPPLNLIERWIDYLAKSRSRVGNEGCSDQELEAVWQKWMEHWECYI